VILPTIILGVSITFLPLHIAGFNTLPRRIPDHPDALVGITLISSIGSLLTVWALGGLLTKFMNI